MPTTLESRQTAIEWPTGQLLGELHVPLNSEGSSIWDCNVQCIKLVCQTNFEEFILNILLYVMCDNYDKS